MLKKAKKYFQLLTHPKKYIEKEVAQHLAEVFQSDFFVPIEDIRAQDTVVVGYPKSGNTWMQALLASLQYRIPPQTITNVLIQEIVPDVNVRKFYKRLGEMTFFKSHELPQPNYRKVIYLIRDGRDVMVSYFHYLKLIGFETPFEQMVKEGKTIYPSKWHTHIKAWLENPFQADLLLIKYEELLHAPIETLTKVCQFAAIETDEAWIKTVVEQNSIQKMRQRTQKEKSLAHKHLTDEKAVHFFRKGKTGSYKSEFPPDLLAYFVQESEEQLQTLGYL